MAKHEKRERELRARLHFLLRHRGMIRASLVDHQTKCGKPHCPCAEGALHRSKVIEAARQGKTAMRTVPPHLQAEIELWVQSWREIQALLEELSEMHWDKFMVKKKRGSPEGSGPGRTRSTASAKSRTR